jgi:hypothetical protein
MMAVLEVLEQAQGGQLFRKIGELAGIAPSDARRATEALCPPIAARLRDKATDPDEFQRLLDLLEDNEGDLLRNGDLTSAEVREDGAAILMSIYGSDEAARNQARSTAQALLIDKTTMEELQPIAASLVLAVLSKRYRQEEDGGSKEPAAGANSGQATLGDAKPGILSIFIAAVGTAIARAVVNRLLPRRRRRTYGYSRGTYGYRRSRRRRSYRREPRPEDLFRDLLR